MSLGYKTMGLARGIPNEDHGGSPWKLSYMCMKLCGYVFWEKLTKRVLTVLLGVSGTSGSQGKGLT